MGNKNAPKREKKKPKKPKTWSRRRQAIRGMPRHRDGRRIEAMTAWRTTHPCRSSGFRRAILRAMWTMGFLTLRS